MKFPYTCPDNITEEIISWEPMFFVATPQNGYMIRSEGNLPDSAFVYKELVNLYRY